VIRKNFYEARLYLIGFKICKDKLEPIFITKLYGARVMVI